MGQKFFVFCIIIIISTGDILGQRFHGGIRGGLVASEVSGDNLSGPNKLGWHAAAFTFTRITDYSDLWLEIMYIQKGSRSVPNEKNNFYEYKFYLQYVEVPLYYRMDIARFTDVDYLDKLLVSAGLSVSVLVNSFESDDGTTIFLPGEKEDFHPAELNLLIGISYPITSYFDFTFGITNSLTPLRPHSGGGKTWYNRGQYNTAWTFGLSYVFW